MRRTRSLTVQQKGRRWYDHNMDQLVLTSEEFAGLASCLAQIANVKVSLGAAELSREEFIQMMIVADPMLAALVHRWLDASRAMREHIEQFHFEGLLSAEPFRLGISGHVM